MPFLKVVGGVTEKCPYSALAFWLRSSGENACLARKQMFDGVKRFVQVRDTCNNTFVVCLL